MFKYNYFQELREILEHLHAIRQAAKDEQLKFYHPPSHLMQLPALHRHRDANVDKDERRWLSFKGENIYHYLQGSCWSYFYTDLIYQHVSSNHLTIDYNLGKKIEWLRWMMMQCWIVAIRWTDGIIVPDHRIASDDDDKISAVDVMILLLLMILIFTYLLLWLSDSKWGLASDTRLQFFLFWERQFLIARALKTWVQ